MQFPSWIRRSQTSRRRAISKAERRRRDELFIPLEVGRLEDRRVLSASTPTIVGSNNLTTITHGNSNNGNTVLSLEFDTTNTSGIAITAYNSGSGAAGTWQYSTNNGNSWTALPSLGGQAFVLKNSDLIRFSPNVGFTGNSASISFLAWNGSGATDASLTTTDATNYSSNTVASGITVNAPPAPTLSDTGSGATSQPIQDDNTVKPFDDTAVVLSINESDTTDLLTISVTQELSNGTTDSTLANGSLSGSGFTTTGNGVWTLTNVTAATATTDLQSLLFTPTRGTPGATVTTKFSLSVTDSYSQNTTFLSQVATTGNVQPVLNGAGDLQPIPENSTSATITGIQVGNLILNETVDSQDSSLGIAITSVGSGGKWYWSTDNSSWTQISGVSATNALLLNNGDFLEFVPDHAFVGTSSITFLAWDGTVGTAHNTFDPTQSPGDGGFSTASATSTENVYPLLSISGAQTTNTVAGQTPAPFASMRISGDSDSTDTLTVEILQQVGGTTGPTDSTYADGLLSGAGLVNDGLGLYSLTGTPATVETELQALIFTPNPAAAGSTVTTTFDVQVTSILSNSSAVGNNATEVVVKTPPVLSGANDFTEIADTSTNPAGMTVNSMIVGQTTDSSDSTLGIAVIATDDMNGTWQYFNVNDSRWEAIPSVSASTAFLLDNGDQVRFLPNSSFAGTSSITFLAWDGSVGSQYGTLDTTSLANSGAVSAGSGVSSITVYPVLSVTGTGTTQTQDDTTSNPFANASIRDTDGNTSDSLTITITQQLSNGSTDSSQTNGALTSSDSFAGFTDNGDGTYTLVVSAADATNELQNLVFTPNPGPPNQTINTTFQIQVTDSFSPINMATDSNTVVEVQSVQPPTLTGSNPLPAIPENISSTDDAGIQVKNLPQGVGPSSGIAITGMDDTNGTWEYSTDGTNWRPIPTVNGLTPGAPLQPSVFLLAANDYIRFLPTLNGNFTGTATISYVAWNQASGRADTVVNPTKKPLNRDLSPTAVSTSITVYPVITIGGITTTSSLDDQTSTPFTSATISDTLAENVTVTITQQQLVGMTATTDSTLADGSLSGSGLTNNGDGTYTLTGTAAQVQSELEALVFAPTLHQAADGSTVTTQFTIQVADATFAPVNTATNSGTLLTVTGTTPPVLNSAKDFTSIPENISMTSESGQMVSSLINATDADGNPVGIAITEADNANGQWYYSTDNGSSWNQITGVSGTAPLLLAPTDLVLFAPGTNFFGTAKIQFLAWDQTVGSVAGTFDPTTPPGSGAFSTASGTSTIQVVAPATITVTNPSQVTNDETSINLFADAFGAQPGITDPNTPLQTYTVTISQFAGGALDASLKDGSLSGTGLTNNLDGTYTLTGTAVTINAELESLIFTPKAHQVTPGLTVTTDFTITVADNVNPPVSNSSINLTVTAVNDPPTFGVQTTPFNLAVLAPNGATVGSALASDVDANANITYAITGGNTSGAYAIDANGNIIVANDAALVFSSTPTVLTITATNSGLNGVAPASASTARSIALWQIVASASPITSDSSTTLTVTLQAAGNVTVPVTINWDDGSGAGPINISTADPTLSLTHFYTSNPDKADPAASIPISVSYPAAGQTVGFQALASVSGTGVGIAVIPVTTSAFVEVETPPQVQVAQVVAVVEEQVSEQIEFGVAPPQVSSTNERQLVLRIVSPFGQEDLEHPIPIPDTVLDDLPGLFQKLPDGHYRIYMVESGRWRMVFDVMVRQGKSVDASEDSGVAGDRPPTSQTDSNTVNGLALAKQAATPANAPNVNSSTQSNPAQPIPGSPPGAAVTLPGAPLSNPQLINPQPSNPSQPTLPPTNPAGPVAGRGKHTADWSHPAHPDRGALVGYGVGLAATAAIAVDITRTDALMERVTRRGLSKSARLARRLRKAAASESGNDQDRPC